VLDRSSGRLRILDLEDQVLTGRALGGIRDDVPARLVRERAIALRQHLLRAVREPVRRRALQRLSEVALDARIAERCLEELTDLLEAAGEILLADRRERRAIGELVEEELDANRQIGRASCRERV